MKNTFGLLILALLAPSAGQAQPAPYKPGLGDLMTMLVQPRHTKLGLAGQAGNWAYAGYELHELQESFDKVARLTPKWRDFAVAETMEAVTKPPMAALSEAIKASDAAGFTRAYKELTEACNLCHTSAGPSMIVIQAPSGAPFPDQDFRPVKQ